MINEEKIIIDMARAMAKMSWDSLDAWSRGDLVDAVCVAYAVARKAIGEECAKIEDEISDDGPDYPFDNGGTRDGWRMGCSAFAAAIRKLTGGENE